MKRNKITLERPERFTTPYTIPKAKLEAAASEAFDMLKKLGRENGTMMPLSNKGFRYIICGLSPSEPHNTFWVYERSGLFNQTLNEWLSQK